MSSVLPADLEEQAGRGPLYAEFAADMLLRYGQDQFMFDILGVLERRRTDVTRQIQDVHREMWREKREREMEAFRQAKREPL